MKRHRKASIHTGSSHKGICIKRPIGISPSAKISSGSCSFWPLSWDFWSTQMALAGWSSLCKLSHKGPSWQEGGHPNREDFEDEQVVTSSCRCTFPLASLGGQIPGSSWQWGRHTSSPANSSPRALSWSCCVSALLSFTLEMKITGSTLLISEWRIIDFENKNINDAVY